MILYSSSVRCHHIHCHLSRQPSLADHLFLSLSLSRCTKFFPLFFRVAADAELGQNSLEAWLCLTPARAWQTVTADRLHGGKLGHSDGGRNFLELNRIEWNIVWHFCYRSWVLPYFKSKNEKWRENLPSPQATYTVHSSHHTDNSTMAKNASP